MRKKLSSVVVLLGIIIALSGCVTKPILNLNSVAISVFPTGEQPSYKTIQKAIIRACQDRGWTPIIKEKGVIEASINVRHHFAQISIKFDTAEYSIDYISSQNLDYANGEIHRTYNNWIANLSRSIQKELSVETQKAAI